MLARFVKLARRVRKPILVIAAFLVATSAAFAQPPPPPPAPLAAPPGAQPSAFGPPSQLEPPRPARPRKEPVRGQRLSEITALELSVGGTVVGWSMFIAGFKMESGKVIALGALGTLLGPSVGHWYGGAAVTRGMGLRLAGGAAAFYGFVRVAFCETGCSDKDGYLMLGGALLYVVATLDDVITAPRRVRRHNEALELGLAPMVAPRAAGIALGGRF